MSFFNSFLKQITTGDNLKDYSHASKVFTSNAMELSPKMGFLFHVIFEFADTYEYNKSRELSLMVKSADLPKFDVDTKTLNSYNRPNIIQTKVKYNPVNLTFHDDSANVVRDFWKEYFTFYYRDSDIQNLASYEYNNKYASANLVDNFYAGYTPVQSKKKVLNAVRIFSLSKKQFSEFVLVNPIITSFQHGRHENSGDTNPLEITIGIEYENVLFGTGDVSEIKGAFGDSEYYDKVPSALYSGTQSILGPGGLLSSTNSILGNLSEGNFLSAALGAAKTAQTFKGANLKNILLGEATNIGKEILRGNNTLSRVNIPDIQNIAKNASDIGSSFADKFGSATETVSNVTKSVSNGISSFLNTSKDTSSPAKLKRPLW